MKLLLLGGSNSRNSGGVFDTARMMGLRLHEHNNINVEYLMFDDEYSQEDRKYYSPLTVHSYRIRGPKNLGLSADLYKQMKSIKPDIVHTQSLWMYLSYANKKYHRYTGTPYIISPHGMLDKWQLRQSFWKDVKKRIVLGLYEKKHMEEASCFHALCQEEHDAIREFGLKNPIAIIPNGIEECSQDSPGKMAGADPHKKKLLFLGRIHPKKGLDNLLEGWALSGAGDKWQLIIAGETKDNAYMQFLKTKARDLKIDESVAFIGGQFGAAKQSCFYNCDAFILPSFSEGLPISVLEAWSYRLPVLMTPQCNLAVGFAHNAAIRTETDPYSICDGIQQLVDMPAIERLRMGQQGFQLVKKTFSWTNVADSMTQLYNWVLGKTVKPAFVHT
ncbi:MAG: glycosyltransferase [Chitinophagales bacterium]